MTHNRRQGSSGVRFAYAGYIAGTAALLLFSYTQVDLNLTLSRAGFFHGIQQAFVYIGYYQRPLATLIYAVILGLMFTSYWKLLGCISRGEADEQVVWRLMRHVMILLFGAYPAAFSYDFFNYLFTAKTVALYGQNPYTVTPLLFAGIDPWTNFMRWTHLSSAYSPLWIFISVLGYAAGLGYFLPALFAVKAIISGFYFLSVRTLASISAKDGGKGNAFVLASFALNPLIVIESLVSGHNDIVMVAFALLALYAYVSSRERTGWFAYLSLSVASKLMTIVLIPLFFLRKNMYWMFWTMLAALSVVLLRREFLPWYWVWIMPFAVLTRNTRYIRAAGIISLGLLLSYAPYVYFGEYSQVSQNMKQGVIWSGVVCGALSFILRHHNDRLV